jgi:hypothetical protein
MEESIKKTLMSEIFFSKSNGWCSGVIDFQNVTWDNIFKQLESKYLFDEIMDMIVDIGKKHYSYLFWNKNEDSISFETNPDFQE